jgi:hypothetical protein
VIEPAAKVSWKKRFNAAFFVLAAFAFWFLFVLLARVVTKCVPVFASWWPRDWRLECTAMDAASLKQLTWPDTIIMVVTLAVAIWAARRAVFPPDD